MKKRIFLLLLFCASCLFSFGQSRIHHLVLFKLKPGILNEDSRFTRAISLLEGLPKEIPEILEFRAGPNFSNRPIASDYGLMVVLADEENLKKYLEHPSHKAVAAAWKEIAEWSIADFWSASSSASK